MTEFWHLMAAPFVACLVLTGIHAYLGLHVIERGVIFVDLALAQIAALGSSVAFLFGFELADPVTYWTSLTFALIGAWVFSVTRMKGERIPQEAIIGLSFAIASAGSILLSAENPHGAEHLRDIMTGSILVVTVRDIRNAGMAYAAIGLFHWVLRDRFLLLSRDPEEAARGGMRVRAWDFLFYASFALVITMSVHIGGVLLVFCLLIAPAVCGALFAESFAARLWIGWGASLLALAGGLLLCGATDWPPAPSIICVFAAILIGAGVIRYLRHAASPGAALARVGTSITILALALYGMVAFLRSDFAQSLREEAPPAGPPEHSHGAPEHGIGETPKDLLAALADEHENVRAKAAEELGAKRDAAAIPALEKALADPAAAVKEKAAQALGTFGRPESAVALERALGVKDEDEWVALRIADALCRCGGKKGMEALIRMAADADAGLVRTEALKVGLAFAGRPAVKDGDAAAAQAALTAWKDWWKSAGSRVRWDGAQGRFVEP